MHLSSIENSRNVPGNNPKDKTSTSSPLHSGVDRIRPTTNSWQSFHITSSPFSWHIVIFKRRWIPWWSRNMPWVSKPEHMKVTKNSPNRNDLFSLETYLLSRNFWELFKFHELDFNFFLYYSLTLSMIDSCWNIFAIASEFTNFEPNK